MANKVLINIVRSDAKTFVLGSSTWRILSNGLTGIDFPSFTVYSDKYGAGDGALLSGKRIDDRDIQIKCRCLDLAHLTTIRSTAIAFFSPKYSYTLHITYQGVTRWIAAELEGFSLPSENIHRALNMTVKFFCPDPLFKSETDYNKELSNVIAGFGFPWMDAETPLIPIYASMYSANTYGYIKNDGDAPTYPRIYIDFTGTVVNPKVYRDDTYYVKILDSFEAGDRVVIDTDNCTITKNGTNWIQYIDRTSTFTDMQIAVGSSLIGYAADAGEEFMVVNIYYNKIYMGL